MNIREFKIGSIVVRTEPSKKGDSSYIGDKLVLINLANGCAYLKILHSYKIYKSLWNEIFTLKLHDFSEGWDFYRDVNSRIDVIESKNESIQFLIDVIERKRYGLSLIIITYYAMKHLFWKNVFSAMLVLLILPLISAYREYQFIKWQKEFEYSKSIFEFRTKKLWWKILKTHYQSWYEKLIRYKEEREKMRSLNTTT